MFFEENAEFALSFSSEKSVALNAFFLVHRRFFHLWSSTIFGPMFFISVFKVLHGKLWNLSIQLLSEPKDFCIFWLEKFVYSFGPRFLKTMGNLEAQRTPVVFSQ